MEVNLSTMCDNCPDSTGCLSLQENRTRRSVTRVRNPVGAQPGDIVELSIADGVILWGAAVIYLVPVAFLLVFMAGASYLNAALGWNRPEVAVLLSAGLAGLALSLVAVRLISTRCEYLAQGQPGISRVIQASGEDRK